MKNHLKPNRDSSITRRQMLAGGAGVTAAAVMSQSTTAQADDEDDSTWSASGERIRQSVVHWCYQPMPVETLARAAAAMGIQSVELVQPADWPILKRHGLTCAIAPAHMFVRGLNNPENYPECLEKITSAIEASAEFGCPNVITFSGFKVEGIDDEQGIANTVEGVKRVIGLAESKGVNICIEMLNSRVDIDMKGHPGYQCDSIEWAAEVCRQVGSPRMKILFDIYHVQIMQGDVITRIRENQEFIGHYHTAGVPGRNDLNDSQELLYVALMEAIAETGYEGFVGQEFIPLADDEAGKITALRNAARLCDV